MSPEFTPRPGASAPPPHLRPGTVPHPAAPPGAPSFGARAHPLPAQDDGEVADSFDVHALPVGPVSCYPEVDTRGEADRVTAVLRRLGGRPAPGPGGRPGPALLHSLSEADDALARWAGEYGDRAARPSVLLWIGHGVAQRSGPALLVPAGAGRRDDARVTPDLVAHHLHREQQLRDTEEGHWAVVVIEACNAAGFAKELNARLLTRDLSPCSLLLVGSGRPAAQGYLGAFRAALEGYLDEVTCRDEVFSLRDLQCRLKGRQVWAEIIGEETARELRLRLRDRVPLAGAVTVAEQRRLQAEFDGAPERSAFEHAAVGPGFLEVVPDFTGRTAALDAVSAWYADPGAPPVLVVTGPPGTGKSALLGEVLHRFAATARSSPDRARIGAVLRLTGSTPEDVSGQLARALGAPLPRAPEPSAAGPGDGEREGLRRRLADRAAPTAPALVMADALDEARDPVRVGALLRELTEAAGVRLVVGTRPRPYGEEGTGGARLDLRAVLGSTTGRARVLELAADPDAAADYAADGVRRILGEHPVQDAARAEAAVGRVRRAVHAHVAGGSWQFLQAALAVRELEQRPGLLAGDEASAAGLEQVLARDRTGLFGAALDRITKGLPAARPLLAALALGQGRGLPRADGVWVQAAAGIAGGADTPGNEDASLLLSRAAAYVLLDGEDRRSVYRLGHRTYAEQLQAATTAEERLGMLGALLELADRQCAAGQPVSPHLRTRLAQYAADCGAPGWKALAGHPAVLDRLPVAALGALALAPGGRRGVAAAAELPAELLGTVASAHLIDRAGPGDRPGLRQLGGLRATGRLHPAGSGAAWEVCWGRLRPAPPHLTLDTPDGGVSALAARPSAPWLATGSLDGTVVVWTPWTTHRPALLLRGHDRPVTALAAHGGPEGPGVLLAAYDDRTLHRWDTGAPECAPAALASPEAVRVLVALPDGSGRFAAAGDRGHLALLGPGPGSVRTVPGPAASDVVGLVPLPGPGGGQWLAAAHRSGELELWDVTGREASRVASVRTRVPLTALAAVTDASGARCLATATSYGDTGDVRLWRVDEAAGRVALLSSGAPAPAAGAPGGRVLATLPTPRGDALVVAGSGSPPVLLRPGGGPGRTVGRGDAGGATDVAVLAGPGGGHVVATAALRDPRVRLWAPGPMDGTASGRPAGAPRAAALARWFAPDGTETVVVAEEGGAPGLRVLRAADGRETAPGAPPPSPRAGAGPPAPAPVAARHRARVMGWAELEGAGCTGRWASLGREGDLRLWQERAGGRFEELRRVPLGSPGVALAALRGGRLAVAVEDGVAVLATAAGEACAADGGGRERTDD
ncbi:AAA family ATPase [Streptomyces sp. C10-9-1]|uniref:AAA family ATPase n=1 Tax=Streptomyces sp. C10-9-1 TaxID=1859285 RepID=UPI0021124DF5|nr:AAA family ATPase [Streptomyces sp. C10-9-1]MCQ6551982.1 AAA family ATPase [Streptomyces sp. C10-9-1]